MEDAGKSEQDKKTYLIGILTKILQKPDSKNLMHQYQMSRKRIQILERVKENTKVVNDGDKENDIHVGKNE